MESPLPSMAPLPGRLLHTSIRRLRPCPCSRLSPFPCVNFVGFRSPHCDYCLSWLPNHMDHAGGPNLPAIRTITSEESSLVGDMLDEFAGLFVTLTMLHPVYSATTALGFYLTPPPLSADHTATHNFRRTSLSASATRCWPQGIIRPSDSISSSPMLLMKKRDDS